MVQKLNSIPNVDIEIRIYAVQPLLTHADCDFTKTMPRWVEVSLGGCLKVSGRKIDASDASKLGERALQTGARTNNGARRNLNSPS